MTAAAATAAVDPLRVVLMDDTPDIRLLLRVALESADQFRVVGDAGDGRSGVELVRQLRPDVVILDLAMPVMDGMEALDLIARDTPDTRVIVLSAFEAERMAEQALAAGATAYVQKGTSAKRIVSSVCAALGVDESPPAPMTPTRTPVTPRRTDPSGATRSELDRVHAALAGAAHELRGPATVLLAMTELLSTERDSLDTGTFNRMLDAIHRQAQVLDRVTSDLLASTQSQRGVLTVDVEATLLRPLIESAALAVSGGLELRLRCDPDLCVRADPTRVQQMLGNLVSNAIKYGAAPIEIAAAKADDFVTVRVIDHGAGVPAEFRARLFGQFARAEGARVNGMGLGLFVVRSLTEAQGGRAWHEGLPGGGSAFCFTLPSAEAQIAHAPARPATSRLGL
jgi:signal transduction histidine kinase